MLSASDELLRETGQPHHVVRSHNELNVAKVASCVSKFFYNFFKFFQYRSRPAVVSCEVEGFSCSCIYFLMWLFSFRESLITRRRSFAEYWKCFVARFNDVHAFGYNSDRHERIWTKFGELRVYCSELSLTNFGRDPRRSGSGSVSRIFFVR